MTLVQDRTYTVDEFERLPDSVGYELVDGHLVERAVSKESSRIAARIIYFLQSATIKTSEAEVYGADLTYTCFKDPAVNGRRADASVVRRSRLKEIGDVGTMPIPADLVVEVVSPNDEVYELSRKIELYLSSGVGLVWVVEPEPKIVYVHRQDGTVTKLRENDEITGEKALPEFRCKVAEFFAR